MLSLPVLRRPLAALFLCIVTAAPLAAAVDRADLSRRLDSAARSHPRLFFNSAAEADLKKRIAVDPLLQSLQANIVAEAERQLKTKPVERVLIGRRLLDKSRTAFSRVMHLGLAWRLTGKPAYLERARAELVAASRFADWNPSHFLDVAEMTAAVGVGYDWFYSGLDESTRTLLREAILEKGLKSSLKHNSWTRVTNNWNQVCNAGMAIGALALAECEPRLAAELVARAIDTVPSAMHEYAPDGAYPEGPGYWGYGTSFNVLLISALESTLGSDFGLSAQPGFLATADYYLHVVGPSGFYFNYSDAGRGGKGVAPAMFWFAARRQQPYLLWHEWPAIAPASGTRPARSGDRVDPMALLWLAPGQPKPPEPPARSWTARGSNPVAFHRSSWDRQASFVAIKGGSASINHAHMDVGAFVMDAAGLRWADDLGSQDYNSLESKGIKLFGRTQDAERWNVFRLGTSAHNVLQVDGKQQQVAGHAPIVFAGEGRTVVDLTKVYAGQLAGARRGVALQPDRSVRVQDEVTALAQTASVRWAMVTRAEVTLAGPGRATLKQEGQTLSFRILEPANATLALYPTDPPPAATDARNPGTRMIGFEVKVPAGQTQRLVVQLIPGDAKAASAPVVALGDWK